MTIRSASAIVASCVLALGALATPAAAQKPISLYVALGPSLERGGRKLEGGLEHVLVAAELSVPILPLAVRVDGMRTFFPPRDGGDSGQNAVTVNGVFLIRLPIVQPYAIGGYGRYGVLGGERSDGLNAGLGVRLILGRFGVFVEGRRHWELTRDLVSVGMVF